MEQWIELLLNSHVGCDVDLPRLSSCHLMLMASALAYAVMLNGLVLVPCFLLPLSVVNVCYHLSLSVALAVEREVLELLFRPLLCCVLLAFSSKAGS